MTKPKITLIIDKAAHKKHLPHKQRLVNLVKRRYKHKSEVTADYRPHKKLFKQWLETSIMYILADAKCQAKFKNKDSYEIYLRLVEEAEMKQIAAKSKHNKKNPEVLSFPCEEFPEKLNLAYLGDIVMCGSFIYNEAREINLDFKTQWGHLFIHSILHIFGWEHGEQMEKLENKIMRECGMPALHV